MGTARAGAMERKTKKKLDREGEQGMKKTSRKSRKVKSVKSLPAKALGSGTAKGVRGGGSAKTDAPTENITFNYGKIEWKY